MVTVQGTMTDESVAVGTGSADHKYEKQRLDTLSRKGLGADVALEWLEARMS